ncbi:hypothetical protein [Coprobacillus sp. AF33-1AC]|uniref:hypothetical protein n=1 Tax=Coprobacillus sp. AF33-1AC TaxID=2292032 RepID=UPI000E521F8E|nr:hypothetical protein [Coprobacillus sp. AF33-1AC]RHM59770.1 hypothetical protein DWZ53_08715 [Coprobacillus sp. AF33-1AC]
MAKVFKYGMIIFLTVAFLMQRQEKLFFEVLKSPFQVFDLVKTLVLSACLWNGILNVIEASGMIKYLSFLFKPVLRFIYGNVIDHQDIFLYLSSNMMANLLGVGSLATMSGLKAMQALNQLTPSHHPTREMLTLVVINTAGLSLVPSSMMTLRQSYHARDVAGFFRYSMVIGFIITIVGIMIIKVKERHD